MHRAFYSAFEVRIRVEMRDQNSTIFTGCGQPAFVHRLTKFAWDWFETTSNQRQIGYSDNDLLSKDTRDGFTG
jgi:hypothetical protein